MQQEAAEGTLQSSLRPGPLAATVASAMRRLPARMAHAVAPQHTFGVSVLQDCT